MQILVTGGLGYIGSHVAVLLIESGYEVIIADDLSNSKADVVDRIEKITGTRPKFYKADLCDLEKCKEIFAQNDIGAVMHFAGFKAVGESCEKPLTYYCNNLTNTMNLLECMQMFDCRNFIFSSSATVYGDAPSPMREDYPTQRPASPYGSTKKMIEEILEDVSIANPEYSVISLRYFNPIGAHKSALIGENPNGIPNNLVPYIAKVAVGELKELQIFGDDYDTPDGTGIRDYIHVVDLAQGHLKALKKALSSKGMKFYNLGTGKGHSVFEVVEAFKKASGKDIPYTIAPRRPGDVAVSFADTSKAKQELDFRTKCGIDEMCADHYKFYSQNYKK